MSAQRYARVNDLYQTDLERYLFAPDRASRVAPRSRVDDTLATLRGRWAFGWARCKAALTEFAFFL